MFVYLEESAPMAARSIPDPSSTEQIGQRLRLTRAALGHTQATMAGLMGSSTGGQAFANYEAGDRRISVNHALKLCATCGLTMDWIYRGDLESLSGRMGDKIRVQMKLEADEERRRA